MLRAAFVIAVTFSLATSPAMAAAAWTGGDDLPTNPLACDATPAKASAKPYDGGSPTNPPNRKGKKISVVDVPKLIGIGYFNATSKGIADGAKELGKARPKTNAPPKAKFTSKLPSFKNKISQGGTEFCSPPNIRAPSRRGLRRG